MALEIKDISYTSNLSKLNELSFNGSIYASSFINEWKLAVENNESLVIRIDSLGGDIGRIYDKLIPINFMVYRDLNYEYFKSTHKTYGFKLPMLMIMYELKRLGLKLDDFKTKKQKK